MQDKKGFEWGIGRRKTSIARVRIKAGTGKIEVNGRDYKEYFTTFRLQNLITGPLRHADVDGKYDVFVNLRGGGITGQAGAMMMGMGRVLIRLIPDKAETLRNEGYLTRDSRGVERKKPGRPGARKRFQFSKR